MLGSDAKGEKGDLSRRSLATATHHRQRRGHEKGASCFCLHPSQNAIHQQGLGVTLFERMQEEFGNSASVMLTVQYRMNSVIMKWASDELYQSKLTAHETVEHHTLSKTD